MNTHEYLQYRPNEEDAKLARRSKEALSRFLQNEGEVCEFPPFAYMLLMEIFKTLEKGYGVTILSDNSEITTTKAAEILNVSRPFVIKLLNDKKIPYRKVGTHRRIRFEDIMSYKNKDDQKRKKILDQLVAEAQDQNMGYNV